MHLTHHYSFYLKLLAVTLTIFGARLWFLHHFGSSVPYWDQWDGEAAGVFLPWLNDKLTFQHIWVAHNEHRIIFTKLLSLLLMVGNDRQWDPLVEMTVNAFLSTCTALFLILVLRRLFAATLQNVILFSIFLLWTLPYAWENILGGFHSCWYLFNLFTLLAIWGMLLHRHFTWQWWLGWLAGIFAYFNLATGFFALFVIFILKLYLLLIDRGARKTHLPTLLFSGLLIPLFVMLTITTPAYSVMRTTYHADFYQFWTAFGTALSWPWVIPGKWLGLLTYLPFLMLVVRTIKSRRLPTPGELFVLALGSWVILQAASASYARIGLSIPAFRYMDILALGTLANFLSLYFISTWNLPNGIRAPVRFLSCAWTSLWILGILSFTTTIWPIIEQKRLDSAEQLKNTHEFLVTKDLHSLKHKVIPYPSAERLANLLSIPKLQRILPPTLAFKSLESSQDNSPFVLDGFYPTTGKYLGENTLGSYNSIGNPAVGVFVSQPIKIAKTFIEIPVAGYLGEADLALFLLPEGQAEPIPILPSTAPRETWVPYYVRAPAGPFRVVAIDNRPDLWFAIGMPRGVGILSYGVLWLLEWGKVIFFLGLFLGGWLVGCPKSSDLMENETN